MDSLVNSIYLFEIMDTRLLFAFWVWKNNKLRILICVCITITRKVRNLNIKLTVLDQITGLSSPAACRERPSIMSTQGQFPQGISPGSSNLWLRDFPSQKWIFFLFNSLWWNFLPWIYPNNFEPIQTYSIHSILWNTVRGEKMAFFHHSQWMTATEASKQNHLTAFMDESIPSLLCIFSSKQP